MTIKGRFVLASPLLLGLALGCGPRSNSAVVSGKVTYNKNPVTGGTLTLHSQEGPMYPVPINDDGTFRVNSLPPGEMTVTVDTEYLNPDRKMPTYGPPGGEPGAAPAATGPPPGVDTGAAPKFKYVKIPPKYGDPKTSPLKVTITSGGLTKDFELTD